MRNRFKTFKIKKDDKVKITLGKDKGREGVVEKVFPNEGKVLVGGINQYKRHRKPTAEGKKGEVITITKPMYIAKVALLCPKCQQQTRVGYLITKKEKVRICRKCEPEI